MTDFCDLQTVVYAGILTLMIAVIQTELVHPAIVMNVTVGSHIQRQFAQYRQMAKSILSFLTGLLIGNLGSAINMTTLG